MVVMGYSRNTSFCRGMPSDAWTGSGSNMREKRIMMIDFLDMIKSFCFLARISRMTLFLLLQ